MNYILQYKYVHYLLQYYVSINSKPQDIKIKKFFIFMTLLPFLVQI